MPKPVTNPTPNTPAGWWQLPGDKFRGSVAGVIAAIEATSAVPDHWKTAICAEIRKVCGSEFNTVRLDAAFHTGPANLHLTIVPSKQL